MENSRSIRSQLVVAQSNEADVPLTGRLELSADESLVVVRFNVDAFVEFPLNGLVPDSLTAFCCKDRRDVLRDPARFALGSDNWVHLKIRYGTKCKLHYKTVSIEFSLTASQPPFYIDTDALRVVYLQTPEKEVGIKQINCEEFSADRTNMEVLIYTDRACCCNNNRKTAYGKVSCDDGWRSSDCN
jgi:hypothetical protein